MTSPPRKPHKSRDEAPPPAEPAVARDQPPLPTLLSSKQVGAVFGRSDRTVRNWVRTGHLRPVRVGRAVFFRAEDIAALLGEGGPPDG